MPVAGRLTQWFSESSRALPWRSEPREPYAVLVSELMLQQTQVARVADRFTLFLERFPTLAAVAAADESEVVAAWSGLGYYRRARALHRLARLLAEQGEALPVTARELEHLPGIGPYTAAAVASLAHGEAVPVLDGNVLRVGARFLGLDGSPRTAAGRRAIAAWVEEMMAEEPAASVNEGLMELGATVCTPSAPRCRECPLAGECRARATGRQETIPPPRPVRAPERHRWVTAIAVEAGGRWLMRRIDEGEVLRGIWLPPLLMKVAPGREVAAARSLLPFAAAGRLAATVRHSITHRRIEVAAVVFPVPGPAIQYGGFRWEDPESPSVPTSSLLGKLHRAVSGDATASNRS